MKNIRRILAVIGIVLLLAMYIVCFVLAIIGKHEATTLFRAALGATIAVPIVLYAFLTILKYFPIFVRQEEGGAAPEEEDAADPAGDEAPSAQENAAGKDN